MNALSGLESRKGGDLDVMSTEALETEVMCLPPPQVSAPGDIG